MMRYIVFWKERLLMSKALTLARLKNTIFPELYSKYMVTKKLSISELEKLLAVAIYIINTKDIKLQNLGYRIIVEYCNNSKNYKPLYELANGYGLYPISKFIEDNYLSDDDRNFFTIWSDATVEQYCRESIYQTEEQRKMEIFCDGVKDENAAVIAPTSYGKSELIVKILKQYVGKNVCIITSTKALLMQTKKRIAEWGIIPRDKIIIHPEMDTSSKSGYIAVFTQERLQRLFQKNKGIAFDCMIIDEAHELMEDNIRSIVLAEMMIVAQKRYKDVKFKFLTPFISSADNLILRYAEYKLKSFRIQEYIKTEKFYLYDLKQGEKFFYDQFINEFYKVDSYKTMGEAEEVIRNASSKNIIYLNKPTDIERYAICLADKLSDVHSKEISDACISLSEYLQPQYNLIYCLRKGVIYHHGSVPDVVRVFIENLYKSLPEIKYIVTSSTLLSGVNLPANRLFVLDNKRGRSYLRPDAFKNLVGRICRLNEIFDHKTENLQMLEPEIHIIQGKFFSKNTNCKLFIKTVASVESKLDDKVENILLKKADIIGKKEALKSVQEFIENYENGTIPNYQQRYTTTEIGKTTIRNGIREIEIFQKEKNMQSLIDAYKGKGIIIDDIKSLLEAINDIFIAQFPNGTKANTYRLSQEETRKWYSMLWGWHIENKTYSEMINLVVDYWKKMLYENSNADVYVGRWGNKGHAGSHNKPYIDLRTKNESQIVNLAIVRIKEECDFIYNNLMRFVEALHDLKLLNERFYFKLKYGTDDEKIIYLRKNGLSLRLATLLLEKYRYLLKMDKLDVAVEFGKSLIVEMKKNKENGILLYEAENSI